MKRAIIAVIPSGVHNLSVGCIALNERGQQCGNPKLKDSDRCFSHDERYVARAGFGKRKTGSALAIDLVNLDIDVFEHTKDLCEQLVKMEFESIKYWKERERSEKAEFDAQVSKAVERMFKALKLYHELRSLAIRSGPGEAVLNKEIEAGRLIAENMLLEIRKSKEFDKESDPVKKLKLNEEMKVIQEKIKEMSADIEEKA